MMQTLRENTHIVMLILVVAFIGLIVLEWGMDLSGIGTRGQNVVGKINGEQVRYEEIRAEYEQLREMERQRRGGDLDEFTHRRLLQQVWDQRVTYTLLQQQVNKHRITTTDAEILEAIRENPPDYIRQQEIFLTDGQFDKQKYLAALSNPNIQGWEILEAQFRFLLPQQKLIDRITSIARVTDLEVRTAYIVQNEKATVKYVFFDPSKYADQQITVTDDEIKNYYQAHRNEFQQEARVKLEYVMLAKEPSEADEQRVERQINDLYRQIVNGADFEKLAQDFSEDPSGDNGGDLGFFGRGAMVEEFENTAFSTPVGQVAKPVKTRFGWHIIKVEEKKRENGEEQIRARHILLKTIIGQKTLSDLRAKMERLQERATAQNGLRAAAAAESLEVLETVYFQQRPDGYIPRIGYVIGASSFAFDQSQGAISEVLENDAGFYILRVADRKPAGVQALDEVQERIRNTLMAERRKELARKEGEAFLARLNGNNLDALSGDDRARVETTEPFSRQGFIQKVGRDVAFTGAAFRLKKPGQISGLVEGDRGYYLIQLVDLQPIDEAAFEREKENYRQQLLSQEQTQIYNDWLAQLREKAKIENRMSDFFAL